MKTVNKMLSLLLALSISIIVPVTVFADLQAYTEQILFTDNVGNPLAVGGDYPESLPRVRLSGAVDWNPAGDLTVVNNEGDGYGGGNSMTVTIPGGVAAGSGGNARFFFLKFPADRDYSGMSGISFYAKASHAFTYHMADANGAAKGETTINVTASSGDYVKYQSPQFAFDTLAFIRIRFTTAAAITGDITITFSDFEYSGMRPAEPAPEPNEKYAAFDLSRLDTNFDKHITWNAGSKVAWNKNAGGYNGGNAIKLQYENGGQAALVIPAPNDYRNYSGMYYMSVLVKNEQELANNFNFVLAAANGAPLYQTAVNWDIAYPERWLNQWLEIRCVLSNADLTNLSDIYIWPIGGSGDITNNPNELYFADLILSTHPIDVRIPAVDYSGSFYYSTDYEGSYIESTMTNGVTPSKLLNSSAELTGLGGKCPDAPDSGYSMKFLNESGNQACWAYMNTGSDWLSGIGDDRVEYISLWVKRIPVTGDNGESALTLSFRPSTNDKIAAALNITSSGTGWERKIFKLAAPISAADSFRLIRAEYTKPGHLLLGTMTLSAFDPYVPGKITVETAAIGGVSESGGVITSTGTANITLGIKNPGGDGVSCTLGLALYKNGGLVSVSIGTVNYHLPVADTVTEVSGSIDVTETDCTLKAFVWKNFDKMFPIVECVDNFDSIGE
jgi:hypothetical protein